MCMFLNITTKESQFTTRVHKNGIPHMSLKGVSFLFILLKVSAIYNGFIRHGNWICPSAN